MEKGLGSFGRGTSAPHCFGHAISGGGGGRRGADFPAPLKAEEVAARVAAVEQQEIAINAANPEPPKPLPVAGSAEDTFAPAPDAGSLGGGGTDTGEGSGTGSGVGPGEGSGTGGVGSGTGTGVGDGHGYGDGNLINQYIVSSQGSILDNAAMNAVVAATPYPNPTGQNVEIIVPVLFQGS